MKKPKPKREAFCIGYSEVLKLAKQAASDAAEVKELLAQREDERNEAQRHYNEWEDECERLRAKVERVEKLVEESDDHARKGGRNEGQQFVFTDSIKRALRDEEEK